MAPRTAGLTSLLIVTAAACASLERPPSVAEREAARDWVNAAGAATQSGYARDLRRALVGRPIGEALNALRDAGYDCATGEAHENHPDPMSVCQRSFATRACQVDREAVLSTRRAVVVAIEAQFVRDCVGTDRDWPTARRSPIDDGLAAPPRL